jgi:hypothetical protein
LPLCEVRACHCSPLNSQWRNSRNSSRLAINRATKSCFFCPASIAALAKLMPPVLRMDRGQYARGPHLTAEQASRRDHDSCYERGPTREQDQGFAHCGSPRPGANLNVLTSPAKFGHALQCRAKNGRVWCWRNTQE